MTKLKAEALDKCRNFIGAEFGVAAASVFS
jgi:hypothetical protein